jgi:hypothetical protein
MIANLQPHELHWRVDVDVDTQFRGDAILRVVEDAVPKPMPREIVLVPRVGSGDGDQNCPLSSSRRYNASPHVSETGSFAHGVRQNS